jgi:hypothetical protein
MAAAKSMQTEARSLEILTSVVIGVTVLGILLRYALPPILAGVRDATDSAEVWMIVSSAVIDALPSIVLVGALDASRKLFASLARGDIFSDAVGKGVKGIGASLLYAAVMIAVVVPWLKAWVDGDYGFGGVRLDTLTWVLGVVGAALLMVGRLLRRARGLQSELEQFV